jgi:lipopolysaccharide export system protein LptA
MEIISASDMEGKTLEKPTTIHVYWKHRMDFWGAEKQIHYHGGVQAYQDASRLKCEWMQVLLDRPVYLDPERRDKARPPQQADPKGKAEDSNPKIDTIMCFHAPKDESMPRPKLMQPVLMVEEVRENGKLVKFQSIQAPEVEVVNTPLEKQKSQKNMKATSSETLPGTVRIWQAGAKDADPGAKPKDPKGGVEKKPAPRKKGELSPDEEMKLTIVQFGEKMWAEDFRKRAKFWTNVKVVHLPADSPTVNVDLREGEIPKGAIYLEARDTLEVFSTIQKEKDADGKEVDVAYQEMIAIGDVRVRKQGEFFGDADKVTYNEMKGTLTFHGTDKNPATIHRSKGQGLPVEKTSARVLIYYLKTKTVGQEGGRAIIE